MSLSSSTSDAEDIQESELEKELENTKEEIRILKEDKTKFQDSIKTEVMKISNLVKGMETDILKKAKKIVKEEIDPLQVILDELSLKNESYQKEIQELKETVALLQNQSTETNTQVQITEIDTFSQYEELRKEIKLHSESYVNDIEAIKKQLDSIKTTPHVANVKTDQKSGYNKLKDRLKKLEKEVKILEEQSSQITPQNNIQNGSNNEQSNEAPKLFLDLPTISTVQLVFRKQQE